VAEKLTLNKFMTDNLLGRKFNVVYYKRVSCLANLVVSLLGEKRRIKKINYSKEGAYNTKIYGSLMTDIVVESVAQLFSKEEVGDLSKMIRSSEEKATIILLNRSLQPLIARHAAMINFTYGLSLMGTVCINSRSINPILSALKSVCSPGSLSFKKKWATPIPFEFCYKAFKKIGENIFLGTKKPAINQGNKGNLILNTLKKSYKTAFFPHKGLKYGKLYKKDDFYCEYFPKEKTIHIEIGSIDETSRSDYNEEGVDFEVWNTFPTAKNIKDKLIAVFIHTIKKSRKNILTRLIIKIFLLSKIDNIELFLSKFPDLKLACVEFDLIFDPTIAFVLKRNGIITVGRQSRPICAYLPDFRGMIFDVYFAINPIIKAVLENSSNTLIDSIRISPYAVNAFGSLEEVNDYKKLYFNRIKIFPSTTGVILCLDYHSSKDDSETPHPIATINNNKLFYEDIIDLAKTHEKKLFIIRGKNTCWIKMKQFAWIVSEVSRLDNIYVDDEYEVSRHTEKLLYFSEAVVAKYTSALEAGKNLGIPFLVHDYGSNYDTFFSNILEHHDKSVFCHSRKELRKKLEKILKEKKTKKITDDFQPENKAVKEFIRSFLCEN
jgi:hypothetical protein